MSFNDNSKKLNRQTDNLQATSRAAGGLVSISKAAKFLSVSPDTLRNWEAQGKLVPQRTEGGARRYSLEQLSSYKKLLNPLPKTAPAVLSVSKAAKELRVSPDTIRNWDKKGILKAERTQGGVRRFTRSEISRLQKDLNIKPYNNLSSEASYQVSQTQPNITLPQDKGVLRTEPLIYTTIEEINETSGLTDQSTQIPDPLFKKFKVGLFKPFITFSLISVLVFALFGSVLTLSFISKPNQKISQLLNKIPFVSSFIQKSEPQNIELAENLQAVPIPLPKGQVLAESTPSGSFLQINLDTQINGLLSGEEATFSGQLIAPNILYAITPGTNITVTGDPQRPTISSTVTVPTATTSVLGIASFSSSFFTVTSGAVSISDGAITTTQIKDGTVSNSDLASSSITVTAGTGMSGGGSVSLGSSVTLTNAGVTGITGTSNQVIASAETGSVTLSLPQSIGTTADVEFDSLELTTGLLLNGSTSGQLTLTTAATTTDYTFTLPSTGGTSGYVLSTDGSGNTSWINASGLAVAWNSIDDPTGNQTLAMSTYTSSWNWATGTSTNNLFNITSDASSNGTGSLVNIQTGTSSTLLPLRVRAGSTEALTVNANGNVGVGTTNAGAKFEIGDGTDSLQVSSVGDLTFVDADGGASITGPAGGALLVTAPATNLNLQSDGSIDVNIAGGSSATGCTVANSTGNLTCTGDITGSGTIGAWTRNSGSGYTYLANASDNVGLGTSTPTSKLYINATQTSGNIFKLAYDASVTIAGDTTGLLVDLNSGNVTATNQNLYGVNFKIPTVTNTHTSGTKTLTGMLVNFGSGAGINQNGAGGTTDFIAGDFQLPALTQTAGTLNAYGLKVTTPSSITTGGTAYGARFVTTGVGAGTLYGISIDDITAGAGTEYAFNVAGTGWDAVLRVGSTTVINGSGVTQSAGGGTGFSTYTTGDLIYASAANTLSKRAIGNSNEVLAVVGGVPTWTTISGSSCTNCLVNNPTATQTISPTNDSTGLSIRQTSAGSPTADIFNITDSAGSTKYFYVDSSGNVSTGAISNTTLTLTPTTNTTALTLVGTNVTSAKNQYINTKNSSGTIFDLSYGAAQTLAGSIVAHNLDLSTNVTATNQSVSGYVITLPAATNTSGTQNYKGLTITGGAINENGGTATNFYGADITIPALTQTSGTLTAYGIQIDTPSSITTGGTAYGLQVNASGVGAGTLNGINITGITAGAGAETGLVVGSGWDYAATFAGNVGIGVTNPSAALHVGDTGNFLAGQTTGKIGFGGTVSGSDYLMDITLDSTQDWSRGINITQANNAGENSSVINIANTANVGQNGSDRTINNLDLSLTASGITSDNSVNAFGIRQTIDMSGMEIGSGTTGASLSGRGEFISIIGTPVFNSAGSSNGISTYGIITSVGVAPTLTSVGSSAIFNSYGGNFGNTSSSAGNANLTSTAYGIQASSTGNLTTTGTTTHYAGHFTASGTADTNYGIYVSATGATTNNYGLYIDTVSASSGNYALYSNAAAQSYFAGNVGIGTTAPVLPLEVTQTSLYPAINVKPFGNGRSSLGLGLNNGTSSTTGFILGRDIANDGTNDFYIADQATSAVPFFINSSANVGIGNTAPAYPLDIASTTLGLRSVPTINNAGGTRTNFFNTHLTGSSTNFVIGLDNWVSTTTTYANTNVIYGIENAVRIGADAGGGSPGTIATVYNLALGTSISNSTVITNSYGLYISTINGTNTWGIYDASGANWYSSGNVGIGITTPARKLHVYNSTISEARVEGGGDNGTYTRLELYHTDFRGSYTTPNIARLAYNGVNTTSIGTNGLVGSLQLYTESNISMQLGTNNVARMTILNGGNVGIGNTAPADALEVSSGGIRFTGAPADAVGVNALAIGHTGSSGYGKLQTWNSTPLALNPAGNNVGIGITAPAALLDLDSNSNTQALRIRGTAETTEIGSLYVSATGALTLSTVAGSDTAQYIDILPEDDEFGLILRDGAGATTQFANFYVNDTAGTDYLNIILGNTNAAKQLIVSANGNVGIGTTVPGAQLDLSTDSARKLTTTTWTTGSDARFKTNIQSIDNALDIIDQLRPVKYHYNSQFLAEHPSVADVEYYHFIAQEYQQVFPNSVTESDGFLYVNSSNMIPYAIAGIKELNQKLENALVTLGKDGSVTSQITTDKITVSGDITVGGLVKASGFTLDASAINRVGALASVPVSSEGKVSLADAVNSLNNQIAINDERITNNEQQVSEAKILGEQAVEHAQTLDEKVASTSANLSSLSSTIDELLASISGDNNESSNSALNDERVTINDLTPPSILESTGSASLANINITEKASIINLEALDATVSATFKSLGETFLGRTTIAGDFSVDGTFSVTEGSKINAFPILFLQNNPLAEAIDIFNGKVIIDKEGVIKTNTIIASEYKTVSGKVSGSGKILSGQKSVEISNNLVDSSSRILITPTVEIDTPLSVTSKVAGDKFIVSIPNPTLSDISFDWFLINETEN